MNTYILKVEMKEYNFKDICKFNDSLKEFMKRITKEIKGLKISYSAENKNKFKIFNKNEIQK